MSKKPHKYFKNPKEGTLTFKQRSRFGGKTEQEEETILIDYTPKREDFARSIKQFKIDYDKRDANRNSALNVPAKIDLIKIIFHDIFDSSIFERRYRESFGLSAICFTEFNTIGLFIIVDETKFNSFISELQKFIKEEAIFNPDIKFISQFFCYNTEQIIKYTDYKPHIVLSLIDNVEIFQKFIIPIEQSLSEYLSEKKIEFFFDKQTNKIELLNASEEIVREVVDNFDIIQSVNSYAAGLVKPNVFNLPEKSYGFTISNSNDELPIIGVIDTGISVNTPLADIIIRDETFNLTSTSPFEDEANHGTAVATLAALGKNLYPNHIGDFKADAKLLSIKILNGKEGNIVEQQVISSIREAYYKYGVQIFTLTIGYEKPKPFNQEISEYAYALDKLCYDLNILIFISIGNNNGDLTVFDGRKFVPVLYPYHFENENTNLFSPAESMNNFTVGAAASNLENNDNERISPSGSVPAIYTRTFHYNWQHDVMKDKNNAINWHKTNKKLFKPDACNFGGDFDNMLDPSITGIKVMSVESGHFFERSAGTSYAAPMTANLAARIIKAYPKLSGNMQTVKAIIINSCQNNEIGNALKGLKDLARESILGNGIPNDDLCLFSDDNRVTMILEGTIKPEQIQSYVLKIPNYLLEIDRANALLKVTATLCFKFSPLKYHHFAYCPFHVAFGLFKNKDLETEINDSKSSDFKLSESWSQDYYFKPKMLSNSQKIKFTISKSKLQNENCALKIAVNSKLHKLLNELDKSKLSGTEISFSIVLRIEENPIKNQNSNRLYDELSACNNLEALLSSEVDLEAVADV